MAPTGLGRRQVLVLLTTGLVGFLAGCEDPQEGSDETEQPLGCKNESNVGGANNSSTGC